MSIGMIRICCLLLVVGLLVDGSHGYCMRGFPSRRPNGDAYCSIYGFSLEPGENRKLQAPHCLNCICSSSSFSCCSYGTAQIVGMIHIHSNTRCRPIVDGCEMKWVYRGDESRECPDNERFLAEIS